jgi:hypothetical protein
VEASALNSNLNTDFANKPREIDKNVSESTPATITQSTPSTVTQSTPGTVTQSTPSTVTQSTPGTVTQSSDSSEKPKQTPTEYVHELESSEPASYG